MLPPSPAVANLSPGVPSSTPGQAAPWEVIHCEVDMWAEARVTGGRLGPLEEPSRLLGRAW